MRALQRRFLHVLDRYKCQIDGWQLPVTLSWLRSLYNVALFLLCIYLFLFIYLLTLLNVPHLFYYYVFSQQLRSTPRCTTSASSSPRTAHRCASWCSHISRYVTSCGSNRSVTAHLYANTSASTCWAPNHLFMYVQIWWPRYLEARRCCKGSGDPRTARLRLRAWVSLPGSGRVQRAPRSNRSEPAVRRPGCWWWFSLSSPCATCQSACSMSWKGNLPRAQQHPGSKARKQLCGEHSNEPGLKCRRALSHPSFLHYLSQLVVVRFLLSDSQ